MTGRLQHFTRVVNNQIIITIIIISIIMMKIFK